jgi:hypothetical protein
MCPNMLRLIKTNCNLQQIVPRQSGFNGPVMHPASGITQVEIFSPISFNTLIDCVVRHRLHLTIGENGITQGGLSTTVEQILALFYADDGCILTVSHKWLQQALTMLTHLFEPIELTTNTQKTILMTSHPTMLNTNISQKANHRKNTGNGPTYRE